MREIIRHHAKLGVDQIKLSMSGEAVSIFGNDRRRCILISFLSRSQKTSQQRIVITLTKKQLRVWMKVS